MSSDDGSLPSVTPDFVYIVKIGDYQHVLRPADHKSSDNLSLARQAVANIDVARNLLTERGPFLVSEKQQKMDEVICDTEAAINRVIKLLQPARVEQVSEESIRINTKNAWALEDGPKTAATFGRLQTTHDKLKTVLHDLKNIEATAQLDNCEIRASTSVKPPSSPDSQRLRPSSLVKEPMTLQPSPNNLLAWKRSRHRQSRQTLSSDSSSISGVATDDHVSTGFRSPVSSHGFTLLGALDGSARQIRDQASNIDSLFPPSEAPDDVSDVSVSRLSVIHELDGASAITVKSKEVKPIESGGKAKSSELSHPHQQELHPPSKSNSRHNESERASPPTEVNTATAALALPSPEPVGASSALQSATGMKRETFADYRERNKREREYRQEPQEESILPLSSTPVESSTAPQQHTPGAETELETPGEVTSSAASTNTDGGTIHDTKLPLSAIQSLTRTSALEDRGLVQSPWTPPQHGNTIASEGGQPTHQKNLSSDIAPRARSTVPSIVPRQQSHVDVPQGPSTTVQMPQRLRTTMPVQPSAILSPSHTQSSPQARTPSSATQENELFLHAQSQSPIKTHEVFLIDPKLTRLPSLLRAGQKERSKVLPPYPVSDAGSDQVDEDQISELPRLQQTRSAMDRPITAPPVPQPTMRATHPTLQVLQTMEEHAHQRSFSDPIVPQINVTRVPTIPRKPVPYRNSMLVSGAPARPRTVEANTQSAARPHSVFVSSATVSQHGISGPPSPLQSDNDHSRALPTHSSTSLHSLCVQEPSSLESSRRSSVSGEEQAQLHPQLQPPQEPILSSGQHIPNPLAMHPTSIRASQASAYQTQAATMPLSQQAWTSSQPDYRSPAFQQSRHFVDPSHNVHLGRPERPPISRFRDSDQAGPTPHMPLRSQTEPVARHLLEQARAQPRRASEQDQVPRGKHHIDNQASAQSQQAVSHHLTPPYQGRAQLVYIKQQPWPQQNSGLQPPVDRSSITRTAPPADAEHNAKRLPTPDFGRGASLNYNSGRQNIKDKDLFGRQVWRADQQQQQPKQQRLSSYEPQQHSQQRQQQPRVPKQPQAQPIVQPPQNCTKSNQLDCRCDDGPKVQPHVSSHHEETQRIRLTPVQEGQVASSAKASAEIPLYPPQAKSQPTPTEHKQPTKKRSSWLAHQANRHRLSKDRR